MTRLPESCRATVATTIVLLLAFGAGSSCNPKPESGNAKLEKVGNLNFHRNPAPALRQARKSGKRILFDFYADWCVNCKLWAKDAVKYPQLNQALQQSVLVKVYDTDPAFAEYRKKYEELSRGLPFFLVLNSDGSFRWKTQKYKDRAGMIQALTGK